jgi:hypothetical protein
MLNLNLNLLRDPTHLPTRKASTFRGGLCRSENPRSSSNPLFSAPTPLRRYRACLSRTARGRTTYPNKLALRLVFHLHHNMAFMGTQGSPCQRPHLELRLHRQGWYTRWLRDTRVVLVRVWTTIGRHTAMHMVEGCITRPPFPLSWVSAIRRRLTHLDGCATQSGPTFSSFLLPFRNLDYCTL